MNMRLTLDPRKILVILLMMAMAVFLTGCEFFDDVLAPASQPNKREVKEWREQEKKKIEQEKKWAKEDAEELAKEKSKQSKEQKSKKADDEQNKDSLMEDRDERPAGKPVDIFTTNNIQGVQNGGTPARFTLDKKYYITKLGTYHWNDGQGTSPGTIGIKAADGKMYGPWKAKLEQKYYWIAKPDAYIPAGSYTVVDSDPSTLAQNVESGGQGMSWASGIPAK